MFSYLLALNPIDQEMVKIDVASSEATVLVRGLDAAPDGIVVDPQREHIYWTNMGAPRLPKGRAPKTDADLDFRRKNGSIERADFDGSGREYLLAEGSFVTGKQLAGAWSTGRLYWSDREGAAVRSVRIDGTDLRDEVVVATSDADRKMARNQCVGVDLELDPGSNTIYWSDRGAPPRGNTFNRAQVPAVLI